MFCSNIEPTWLIPERQLQAAPPLSPTSAADEKSAWNRRKGGVLEHAQTALAAQLPDFFFFFFWGVELTSRARPRCWSLRGSPSTHASTSTGRHWRSEGKKRVYFLIFLLSSRGPRNELRRSRRRFGTCGRLWWHGVLKQWDPSEHRETRGLHRASCLNADNQLVIYMSVLLHCL